MSHGKTYRAGNTGFSLVELLVVVAMASVLIIAGYDLFQNLSTVNRSQENLLEIQSIGRITTTLLNNSLSHAGFGFSDTNSSFITIQNGDFSAGQNDSIKISYAHKYAGTLSANATDTNSISINKDPSASINIDDYISLFPSPTPNTAYRVTGTGVGTVTVDPNKEILFAPLGAKVFQVGEVEYSLAGTTLQRKDIDGTEGVAFDVVTMQIAYSTTSKPDWVEGSGSIKNPRAVWAYLLLRTRDKEPGYRHEQPLTLPWNNAATFPNDQIESGYHYQEFHTQVWIRNAD